MALPAIADVRRRFAAARLVVAARGGVADLFTLVPTVDAVVRLEWCGQIWKRAPLAADADRLRQTGAALAVLFPNSFASAFLTRRAGVAERWGYTSDLRTRLLTRRASRPRRAMHQGEYYQHLVRELGIENGPLEPEIAVAPAAVDAARKLLENRGWDARSPIVALAAGAAYGRAKQWVPSHVVTLVEMLVR